jgi:hypothetical protein
MTRGWWYFALAMSMVVMGMLFHDPLHLNQRIGDSPVSRKRAPRRILSHSSNTSSADTNFTVLGVDDENDNDKESVSADTLIVLSLLSLVNTALFVVPNTIRYAIRKRQCLSGRNGSGGVGGVGGGCICNEAQLLTAIRNSASLSDNDIAVLVLCPAQTLALTREIKVTDASFRLVCAISRFINTGPCVLTTSSSSSHRFLVGTPRSAILQDVVVQRGNASGSDGGAVYATGGNWTFHNVAFVENQANVGGAIYVATSLATTTPAMVTIFGTTSFRDNVANGGVGNDIYIATKAAPAAATSTAFVKCEPSSILSVPAFCNGASGIVVGSTNASAMERAIYTNCGAVANFGC